MMLILKECWWFGLVIVDVQLGDEVRFSAEAPPVWLFDRQNNA